MGVLFIILANKMMIRVNDALLKNKQRSSLLPRLLILLIVCVGGCATLDSRVYHTVHIFNAGKSEIVNLTYIYGELGTRFKPRLGLAGSSITKSMKLPESIDVKWVTESDGVSHHVQVPLREKVSLGMVREKTVRIEVDGDTLKIFIVKLRPDYNEERTQIFGDVVER